MQKWVLLLMAALIALSACESNRTEPKFEAGTYTGMAVGYGGGIVVEVETDASSMRSIRILSHNETTMISAPALAGIPAQILSRQRLDIDAITGCTLTSRGIVLAVSDALAKSAADMSAILPEWSEDAPVMASTVSLEADVVIIGAGGAGLTAGVEALRSGASVIVLEKRPAPGGNTLATALSYPRPGCYEQYSTAMNKNEKLAILELLALPAQSDSMRQWQSDLRREYEIYLSEDRQKQLFDSRSLFKLQTYVMSGYKADPEIVETYASQLGGGANFLEELGVSWAPGVQAAVGSGWRRNLFPSAERGAPGESFVMPQLNAFREMGGELLCNMHAEGLLFAEDRVVGVTGSTNGTAFEVKARKGVVLATGGYSANKEMIAEHSRIQAAVDALPVMGTSSVTGDGLMIAAPLGATLSDMRGARIYPLYGEGVTTGAVDGLLLVDREGRRFIREDAPTEELTQALLSAEGWAWALTDSHSTSARQARLPEEQGMILRADTLEELAKSMEISPEVLIETVAQFNRAALGGVDPIGRRVFSRPFERSPFYARRISLAISGSAGGLRTDAQARVIGPDAIPIPGLWAAGEVTGGLAGAVGADALVFGRIAGRNAAA